MPPSLPPNSVVSRRQLAAQAAVAKRLAAAAERGGYGVPEASLREAHRQLAEAGAAGDYSRIFSPEELADILAGAAGALSVVSCMNCFCGGHTFCGERKRQLQYVPALNACADPWSLCPPPAHLPHRV